MFMRHFVSSGVKRKWQIKNGIQLRCIMGKLFLSGRRYGSKPIMTRSSGYMVLTSIHINIQDYTRLQEKKLIKNKNF